MQDRTAELIAAAREGDRGALRGLYDDCHESIYRLMVRMVGRQDAADLTQSAFLQAFRRLDQFLGRSSFQTWLYRLAVNEALQHLRRKGRKKTQSLEVEPVEPRQGHVRRVEHKELLEQALAMIDPELRTAFLLRETEERSYQEIAAITNIPEGTVGSRLNRARKELKEHLLHLGWEPES